ncbi:S-adenosyl-L-methionine-dependent methyltransferase [Martensiomyces pterosporus]|nr:S-adenosyl-L-methionine-dependent methyltransferase [Martensiomyces pterosporus]
MERVGKEYLDLSPTDRLLDVNAQWGDLAVYLAHEFHVPTCAIVATSSQLAHATNLTGESQAQRFLRFVTGDYRAIGQCLPPGIPPFTKAVAFDTLDTIGPRNIPAFLRSVNEVLESGGRIRGEEEWAEHWWYHLFRLRYIQPGSDTSAFVSIEQVMSELQRAGFDVLQVESLTTDAALTTAIWCSRLCAAKRQIEMELGEEAYRMWELYLNWTQSLYARSRLHKHFILAVKRA